jgi:hypothetical protein
MKKKHNYIINSFSKNLKQLDRVLVILNIELTIFQINLMLELFVFKVGIIKIISKLLFIKKLFSVFLFQFFELFTFSLNLLTSFHIFPSKKFQVRKF